MKIMKCLCRVVIKTTNMNVVKIYDFVFAAVKQNARKTEVYLNFRIKIIQLNKNL
jgi:hypothetical protein